MMSLFVVGFSFAQTLTSPNGNLIMDFHLSADKTPVYSLKYKGKDVIREVRWASRYVRRSISARISVS